MPLASHAISHYFHYVSRLRQDTPTFSLRFHYAIEIYATAEAPSAAEATLMPLRQTLRHWLLMVYAIAYAITPLLITPRVRRHLRHSWLSCRRQRLLISLRCRFRCRRFRQRHSFRRYISPLPILLIIAADIIFATAIDYAAYDIDYFLTFTPL